MMKQGARGEHQALLLLLDMQFIQQKGNQKYKTIR